MLDLGTWSATIPSKYPVVKKCFLHIQPIRHVAQCSQIQVKVLPKDTRQTKVKDRNFARIHSDGDGPWENQSLLPPLQNTGKRKLPVWRRRPNHRPSTQQMSNAEYTKRKIQTQRLKDWDLATKGTRYNIKILKAIFTIYKVHKL